MVTKLQRVGIALHCILVVNYVLPKQLCAADAMHAAYATRAANAKQTGRTQRMLGIHGMLTVPPFQLPLVVKRPGPS